MRITCRWLNLEAFNQLGIRRDCAVVFTDFGRLLVVLSEGRHLCCLVATRGSVLEICESGEQGVSTAGAVLVSTARESYSVLRLIQLTNMLMNSRLRKLHRSGVVSSGRCCGRLHGRSSFRKVVTWLILPVVICLSQRLSHACLSINKFVL
jgi:hypothetical protein